MLSGHIAKIVGYRCLNPGMPIADNSLNSLNALLTQLCKYIVPKLLQTLHPLRARLKVHGGPCHSFRKICKDKGCFHHHIVFFRFLRIVLLRCYIAFIPSMVYRKKRNECLVYDFADDILLLRSFINFRETEVITVA